LICVAVGLVLGWIPTLFQGPDPQKFDIYYLYGDVAVWSFYFSRMLIGIVVGVSVWPRRWYVRGPVCGALLTAPPGIFALATPGCSPAWVFWNTVTGAVIGTVAGAAAYVATGRDHAFSDPRVSAG
jgi:hypothetical protein